MARGPRTIEEKIERLRRIVEHGSHDERISALRGALTEKRGFLVAKAAAWAAETLSYDLIPDLVESYPRFLDNPLKSDKTCAAKRAIVRALYELDYTDVSFYGRGLHYTQREPVWGGHVDTAVEVRCTCALGLLLSGDPRAMVKLVGALHDPEPQVRAGVIKAMEMAHPHDAELVLRHKILQGDTEAEVVGQAFSSLMKVAAEESIDFVAGYLGDDRIPTREAAALALGESRHETALNILVATSQALSERDGFQHALLEGIALQRSEKGFEYLLQVIESAGLALAGQAIAALSIYSYNTDLRSAVEERVSTRGEPHLLEVYGERFSEQT